MWPKIKNLSFVKKKLNSVSKCFSANLELIMNYAVPLIPDVNSGSIGVVLQAAGSLGWPVFQGNFHP